MSAGAIAARKRNRRKNPVLPYLHKAVDRSIDLSLSRDLTRLFSISSNSGAGWHFGSAAPARILTISCGSAAKTSSFGNHRSTFLR